VHRANLVTHAKKKFDANKPLLNHVCVDKRNNGDVLA
jgi:hypothetical protein